MVHICAKHFYYVLLWLLSWDLCTVIIFLLLFWSTVLDTQLTKQKKTKNIHTICILYLCDFFVLLCQRVKSSVPRILNKKMFPKQFAGSPMRMINGTDVAKTNTIMMECLLLLFALRLQWAICLKWYIVRVKKKKIIWYRNQQTGCKEILLPWLHNHIIPSQWI